MGVTFWAHPLLLILVHIYSFYLPNSHAFLYLLLAYKLFLHFYSFLFFLYNFAFLFYHTRHGFLLYTNTHPYIVILNFVGYLYAINFHLLYPTLSYSLCGYLNYINIFNILVVILVLARVSLPFGNYIKIPTIVRMTIYIKYSYCVRMT